ncbi:MAG: hypothetical protein AB7W59_25505 [Acidimicrobiia bacterium]
MSVTPLDHVLVHVTDALATDPRVQELGLAARLEPTGAGDVVVIEGNVSTDERKANVCTVAEALLRQAGWATEVVDRTVVTRPVQPLAPTEDL